MEIGEWKAYYHNYHWNYICYGNLGEERRTQNKEISFLFNTKREGRDRKKFLKRNSPLLSLKT